MLVKYYNTNEGKQSSQRSSLPAMSAKGTIDVERFLCPVDAQQTTAKKAPKIPRAE
jgi:hypothetical protein